MLRANALRRAQHRYSAHTIGAATAHHLALACERLLQVGSLHLYRLELHGRLAVLGSVNVHVLLRCVVNDLVHFDRHELELFLLIFPLFRVESLAISDALIPDLLLLQVVPLTLGVLPRIIEPSIETNVVIHLQQEGINRLAISDHLTKELFINFLLYTEILLLNSDIIDPVLSLKLVNLHLPVESETAVLAAHASVQQLVEIDVAIVAADAHLKHHFLHLVV